MLNQPNELSANAQELNVKIYPVSTSIENFGEENYKASNRDVGVCFSGGGSRSLSCVLGQLRGLRQQNWLERVHTISCVSGGCWASSLYIFLPENISYDDFLGTGVLPEDLKWDDGNSPESVSYLPPKSMGQAANRLGWDEFFKIYERLHKEKFNDWHQLWRVAISELVFQEFGLYEPDSNNNPTKYFSWSEDYLNKNILPFNPNLKADDFHFARNAEPYLLMNGSMFYPQNVNSIVPIVSTFFYTGIRGNFSPGAGSPNGAGGGFVDSFGFGSQFVTPTRTPDRVRVNQNRPFSIPDMAGISSSAFAEEFWHKFGLKDLEPLYNYWSIAKGGSVGEEFEFADGGLLENSGLASLIANTDLTKFVVFVNGSQAVEDRLDTDYYVQVPDAIPTLFGFQPIKGLFDHDGYKPYKGAHFPKAPLQKHNQIFPSERFPELLDGFKNNTGDLENSAIFFQAGLEVQENVWFGITAEQTRKVDVLWICNNKVKSWEKRIQDSKINEELDLRIVPESGLWNFPYYGTLTQLHLSATQINMLAQLSWWNVTADENQSHWNNIFD